VRRGEGEEGNERGRVKGRGRGKEGVRRRYG